MTNKKQNAPLGGAAVDLAGGLDETNPNTQLESITDAAILASKSTATQAQLAKVLVLLRQGPKTTIELRSHGIMMPAARIFQLKREQRRTITTELVALYDAEGIRHNQCARYHLIEELAGEVSE